MNQTINQRIALYRKLANLTQTEAAERLGMKCSTYSQMERKGTISADKLIALANIFNVTPETLLYEAPPTQSKDMDFTPHESFGKQKLHQHISFMQGNSDTRFAATHKEENILKILRNLPRNDYEEIIQLINEKYKNLKNK